MGSIHHRCALQARQRLVVVEEELETARREVSRLELAGMSDHERAEKLTIDIELERERRIEHVQQ